MKILIIKIGALGDVVRSSFLAQALKDKYKKDSPKIYWLTDTKAVQLFANNPYVDKVITLPEKDILRNLSFDIIVNLEEDKETGNFATNLQSKKLIGCFINSKGKIDYTRETSSWFDMSMISRFGKKKSDRLKKKNKKTHRQILSEMIGVNYKDYSPFLRLTTAQRELTQNFLRRYKLSRADLIIGLNTGSADRWPKSLPVKKTAELIDLIYKKYKAKILLFGGPNEIERNKEIQKFSKSPIIDTGCGNDLIEFPALVSACNIFISTDSLGLHIALALKRRTICLIGPTSPSEIDMYNIGEKILADSRDVCSYKTKSDCMDKIDLKKILFAIETIKSKKITLVITAFNEPQTIGKAIEAALGQKTSQHFDILVSAPDEATLAVAKKYSSKNKNISVFKDPGKGKSFALNLIFKKLDSDILILTDGDVWISENSVEEISNLFLDPEVGCVTGRPVPIEDKKTKYGYWANFLFDSAHKWRKDSFANNNFLECSGYLFAFLKKEIDQIPLDVAEDTIIPFTLWGKGFKIGYAERALVHVKNVSNWRDWIKQKKRTSKAHETLDKYVNTQIIPRAKSFKNESKGLISALKYPRNPAQLYWTFQLIAARAYMWLSVLWEAGVKKQHYSDSWERVESTK